MVGSKIVVNSGRSCCDSLGYIMSSGSRLTVTGDKSRKASAADGTVSLTTAIEWIESGFASPVDDGGLASPVEHIKQTLPGIKAVSSEPEKAVLDPSAVDVEDTTTRRAVPPSRWNVDPASITDKSLDHLNAMVADRLSGDEMTNFEGFKTKKEAVAQLSKDFGR